MKPIKIFLQILVPISCFLIAISCTDKKTTNDSGSGDDQAEREAAIADSIAKSNAKWKEDSLAIVEQTSYDLVFYELHGPVKTMTRAGSVYLFSKDGKLMTVNGKAIRNDDPYKNNDFEGKYTYMKRNKKGQIIEENGWEWVCQYKWDDEKPIGCEGAAESYTYELTYKYNDQGFVSNIVGLDGDNGEATEVVNIKITFPEIDEYGNWTKRVSSGTESSTVTRKITYYPIVRPSGDTTGFNPSKNSYTFTGTIGGNDGSTMQLTPKGGTYNPGSGKRDVKLSTYNPATGDLVIDAFFTGSNEMIGTFTGTYNKSTGEYKGVFTNIKNGGKVNFSLQKS